MSDPNFERAELLFHRARALPPLERAEYLDGACAGDLELRREVESLLASADCRSEEVLPLPRERPLTDRGPLAEGPGARIGRFKLLQQLGEGGFGTVYMAEQQEPVRRQVALKIIKLGMDTKQVVARFEAERQALALMDHPNIAKVLDAGVTDTGRPFFVMELVRGIEITRFCDDHALSPEARLRLFVDVCGAVHHAHQKGVLHRDLKPSNVLVTLHDGVPVPKVIDFGIAKATNQRLTEKTLFTEFGQLIGTLEYMSPEQAELSGLDVDTRTDVYSLGVLLYELLTGSTPMDPRTLREATYDEIQRILREVDPPAPSTRVSTAAEGLEALAGKRGVDARTLGRSLRGDLDWIVMRALEKDRRRRYESARELARDVERHLAHEAVEAGPPGLAYRVGKVVRRNRALVAGAAAVLAVLVLGIVGTTAGMLRAAGERDRAQAAFQAAEEARVQAEEQRREAERQRELARQEADRARAATAFLTDLLALADPQVGLSGELDVQPILDRASEHLPETLADQPDMEAAVRTVLGRAYGTLGELEESRRHLLRALELVDAREDPDREDVYAILWPLTTTLFTLGSDEMNAVGRRMVVLAIETIAARRPELARDVSGLVDAVGNGRFDEAAGFADRVEAGAETLEPGDPLAVRLADVEFIAGVMSLFLWGHPDAERHFRSALARYRRELPESHPQISTTLEFLVFVLHDRGRHADAEELIRESLTMREQVFPAGNWNVAVTRALLAENLIGQGRFEEAEPLLRRAHAALEASRGLSESMYSAHLFETLYRHAGRVDEAEQWADWLAGRFATAQPRPPVTNVMLALYHRCPPAMDAWLAALGALEERRPEPERAAEKLAELAAACRDHLTPGDPLAVAFARELHAATERNDLPEDLRAAVREAADALLAPRGLELSPSGR